MQRIQAVGVVDVGVRILRLGVDRLVGRGEVGRLEVGIRGVGQRRGAGVGRLTYSAQLGQPCRPVAGAVVTVLAVFVLDIIRQFPKHFHGSA